MANALLPITGALALILAISVPTSTALSTVIKFEELQNSLESDNPILLIDVRSRRELVEDGQIPGSVSLPLPELLTAFKDLDNAEFEQRYGFPRPGPEREDVVLTCRSGARARRAKSILAGLGYDKVRVYSGSFNDWVRNGGDVV